MSFSILSGGGLKRQGNGSGNLISGANE